MKIRFSFEKYPFDIIFCMIWSVILLPVALLNIEGTIRVILGLPFILFIPGYILVFSLFPEKKTDHGIDIIERIALSFGLSLAVVPLIGLGLNYTVWGIRLEPILFSLFIFNIGIGTVGIIRWYKTDEEFRFKINFSIATPKYESRLDKILTIILVSSIIIAASLLVYVIITPKTGERFTEFYLLGANRIADDYPNNLALGENASLIVGISNHEYKEINYTVEIWLINQTLITDNSTNETEVQYHNMWFMDSFTVNLKSIPIDIESEWEPQLEYIYNFSVSRKGTFKLTFLLFDEVIKQRYFKEPDYVEIAEQRINKAYRSLHIWLNVG